MNRLFTYISVAVVFFGYAVSSIAADLASRDPQPRNVVLEEYTGIHCVYCPDGHKRARELKEANPGRVVLINVHAGGYAVPSAGEPDFRTPYGEALVSNAKVAGIPAGSINRMVFPGVANQTPYTPQTAGGTALSRGGWNIAAHDSVLNGSISPVNIGAATKWTKATRELSIDVELYFTSTIKAGGKLNVGLIESHIWGPQTGGDDPAHYEHNFMLRTLLTGQWGELVVDASEGTSFTKNYKYTVPENINIENCDIVVFVTSNTNQYIYTGITQPAITPNISISATGNLIDAMKSNQAFVKTFTLTNTSDKELEYSYSVDKSERTPDDWSAKLVGTGNTIKLGVGEKLDVDVSLTPGATLGIGDAVLSVMELNNPDALVYKKSITVVSADAKYLEVNAGGTMENVIKDGGRPSTISLALNDYSALSSKLSPMVAVWNFGPKGGLTSPQATMIDDMITKKGIGVLINGSVPLPMLSFEAPSHSLFSTLGISWKTGDDIQLNSFNLEGEAGDPVADGFKATCTPANNGYFLQPMSITNSNTTKSMIKCTDQDKTVSVRVENNLARAVYLSFNLDIINNTNDKINLIKKAIDWIEGGSSDVLEEMTDIISLYPNPVVESMRVKGLNGMAKISDVYGRAIWNGEVVDGSEINLSGLSSGVYMLNINNKVYKFVKE